MVTDSLAVLWVIPWYSMFTVNASSETAVRKFQTYHALNTYHDLLALKFQHDARSANLLTCTSVRKIKIIYCITVTNEKHNKNDLD